VKKVINPNRKAKITLAISPHVLERMRNVVYWTPGLTLATLTEEAVEVKLKKLEKGRRFRKRRGKIPVGRPRKHQPPMPRSRRARRRR
jgi:hypothetical protein